MNMASEKVAYAGIENFDLILYQAGILTRMKKKVLVVECLERGRKGPITSMIPIPRGLDPGSEPVTFRRVDFTTCLPPENILKTYDIILISCETNAPLYETKVNRMVFVTDLFTHNMESVKSMIRSGTGTQMSLLVKNNVIPYVNPDFVAQEMDGLLKKEDIDILDLDGNDLFNAVLFQQRQSFKFTIVSKKTRRYLLKETKKLCPGADSKSIITAFRAAKKGD